MAESEGEPHVSISDTKLFKYRNYELELLLTRAWRVAHGLSEAAVVTAGSAAVVCRPGSTEPITCRRCGKIVIIRPSRTVVNDASLEERYIFSVRSHCTSSRDHLKSSLVIALNKLPGAPVATQPFIIQARIKARKAAPAAEHKKQQKHSGPSGPSHREEADEDVEEEYPAAQQQPEHLQQQLQQQQQVALLPSPTTETRVIGALPSNPGTPRMLARVVRIDMDRTTFEHLLECWRDLLRTQLGSGFVAVAYSYSQEQEQGSVTVLVVTTYATICDAVRGNMLCGAYSMNRVPNIFLLDLSPLVHPISVCSSW